MLKHENNRLTLDSLSLPRVLFVSGQNHSNITAADWLTDVEHARVTFVTMTESTVLLCEEDFYAFTVAFVALIAAGKNVILPPNLQPATMKSMHRYSDCVCPPLEVGCAETLTSNLTLTLPTTAMVTFFTSGSSGEPKLVRKQLDQLVTEVMTLDATFGQSLSPNTLFAATVPTNHIYGLLFRFLWPLLSSHQLYRDTIKYSESLQQLQQPYCLVSSPAHLTRFQDFDASAQKPVQVFSSGGPLAYAAAVTIKQQLALAAIEVFGSTETGGIAWRQSQKPDSPWQVFQGISIECTENGCLRLRSPFVCTQTWIETQDQVEMIDEQHFHLRGRADRIVKLAEKRLSLPEIENYCQRHPWVSETRMLVLAQKRSSLGAVVVLNQLGKTKLVEHGKLATNQNIREYLAERFDRVVLPRKFRYIDSLPCDERGKTSERQLKELFQ